MGYLSGNKFPLTKSSINYIVKGLSDFVVFEAEHHYLNCSVILLPTFVRISLRGALVVGNLASAEKYPVVVVFLAIVSDGILT